MEAHNRKRFVFGYVFPWAGWKEVVLENYAVNTALL
jgi:hypothetical protein